MSNANITLDGTYFLLPEGCAWKAVVVRRGRLVASTEECLAGTHQAARDDWGRLLSEMEGEPDDLPALEGEEAMAVCRLLEIDPMTHVVARL